MKATGARPKIIVGGGGRGVVGHAGARLLADVADATGLTGACSDVLAGLRQRRGVHDPGRVAVDVAVMLADGGQAISDLAVLRDQAALFGPVASDPTAWRLLSELDGAVLDRLRTARAQARELAWAQRIETRGSLPQTSAAGLPVPGLVLDLDASIVICHSEKESATPTWKHAIEDAGGVAGDEFGLRVSTGDDVHASVPGKGELDGYGLSVTVSCSCHISVVIVTVVPGPISRPPPAGPVCLVSVRLAGSQAIDRLLDGFSCSVVTVADMYAYGRKSVSGNLAILAGSVVSGHADVLAGADGERAALPGAW